MDVSVQISKEIEESEVVALYQANGWSSATVPEKLIPALLNSDTLVTARADGDAVDFYRALGFERAGKTEPMWVYAGNDH